ncbi:MAG TPA: prenyltransferase/squalene oxidase repeat-containing protein [Leadbetterella sp.]|nr:prenyltransferase/squalene oxidase repeat-containing protein [Leadbetterella sp.]
MRRFGFILLVLISSNILGQEISLEKIEIHKQKALTYLENSQIKTTTENKTFAGEWPAYMHMTNAFVLLGKSEKYRDSNCFNMTGVFNALAEAYLQDTSQVAIKNMLKRAYPELLSYRKDSLFNFWKLLPPNRDLSRKTTNPEGLLVRRPTHYKLKTRFINNAANVAFDNDDTSMGNLSLYYYSRIFGEKHYQNVGYVAFDKYLDTNRKAYHWHNYLVKIPRETSAFLTWQGKEREFKHWSFFKAAMHNLVFYLPSSCANPRPFKPYIPWGANDIDAVVNANILTYLGSTQQLENSKGRKGAERLINYQINRGRWSRAGMYYPNKYHFHYAVSRSMLAGKDKISANGQAILSHLLDTQFPDGRFESRRKVNKKDILQSTVYGLTSLLNLKELGYDIPKDRIDLTMSYLLKHQNEDGSWNGGVFFSGGTVVRNVLHFKSEAYTTALMVLAMNKWAHFGSAQ